MTTIINCNALEYNKKKKTTYLIPKLIDFDRMFQKSDQKHHRYLKIKIKLLVVSTWTQKPL